MATPADAGRMLGRYVLFQPIAKGGMASVHLGRLLGPVGFARTVAIKRLHEHLATDPEFVRMFLQEARLAARIQHPNVVATLDVVAEQNEVLLVLEYVHGESLARLIRAAVQRREPIPLPISLAILADLLSGLHAAHEAKSEQGVPMNIVHRDVSPQNLLVGVDGVARVLDFGVAKAEHKMLESTGDGRLKGKLAYMAPEQLRSQPVDRRADIFSASVVAWELLTGHRLFASEEPGTVVLSVLQKNLVPPSKLVPSIPRKLDEIILKGLERNPAARYSTAEEMALQIERVTRNASPREVGAWVAGLMRDVLGERSAMIERVERATDAATPITINSGLVQLSPGVAPPPAAAPAVDLGSASQATHLSHAASLPPRQRRPWRIAAAALGVIAFLALGATGMYWLGRSRTETAAAASPASAAMVPAAAPSATSTAPAKTAESPAPAPSGSVTAAPSSSAPRVSTRSTAGGAKPHASGAPKPTAAKGTCKVPPNCQPPWTIDAAGTKKFKPECASYLSCLE